MNKLRPLRTSCIEIDGQTRRFPAVVRRTWNGWAVPIVTPKTRALIALHLKKIGAVGSARDVQSIPVRGGLVEVAAGITFRQVPCRRTTASERKHAEALEQRARDWLTRVRTPGHQA